MTGQRQRFHRVTVTKVWTLHFPDTIIINEMVLRMVNDTLPLQRSVADSREVKSRQDNGFVSIRLIS